MSGIGSFFKYLFTGRFDKIFSALGERIPNLIYHRSAGLIFELDRVNYEETKSNAIIPDGYIIRFAEREELPACALMIGLDVNEFYRRHDCGDKCYTVFIENQPVNINWIHGGSCYVRGMGYSHSANKNDYYIYGIMTDRSQRGKGLYKNCLINLADTLFEQNAGRLIQMVEDGNDAVLHTLPKLGYKRTRRIKHLTLFGIKRTTTTDLTDNTKKSELFVFPPRNMFII